MRPLYYKHTKNGTNVKLHPNSSNHILYLGLAMSVSEEEC